MPCYKIKNKGKKDLRVELAAGYCLAALRSWVQVPGPLIRETKGFLFAL